jgi:hypothetical protein
MPPPANDGSDLSRPSAPSSRRSGLFPATLGVVGVLILLSILFSLPSAPPHRPIAWLTPAQLKQATQPGTLTRLKNKLMTLMPFLWQWQWRHEPLFLTESKLLVLPSAVTAQVGLGPPTATNSDGLQGWILSPARSRAFQQLLKGMGNTVVLASPRIETGAGSRGEVAVGQNVPAATRPAFAGLVVTVAPAVAAGSIRLLLGVTSTEEVSSPSGRTPVVRTNFTLRCRTFLPNAGSLVINAGDANRFGASNHWLVVSLTEVDAHGRPIHP